MNKVIKNVLSGAMIAVMSVGFAGCGNSNGTSTTTNTTSKSDTKKPVTIIYNIPSSWVAAGGFKDQIANWEQKTGNKVDVQAIQDDQYDNLIKARISAREGVDIFAGAFNKYDVPNIMLEIKSDEAFVSKLSDVDLNTLKTADGKLYGFPTSRGLSTFGVFYNKKVFNDLGINIPKTLEEFDAACAKIKGKGVTPVFFSGKDGWTMLQHRNSVNGALYGEDNEIWNKLNKNQMHWKDIPAFVSEYKAVEQWVKKGYVNKNIASATYDDQSKNLADGTTAMVFQGSWFEDEVLKKNPKAEIGFFPCPTPSGNTAIASSGFSGGVHISEFSEHPEEALDLLRFLVEPAQVKSALTITPGISAFKDVDASDKLTPALKDVQNAFRTEKIAVHGDDSYIVPMPQDELIACYVELLLGESTAEEFAQKTGDAYIQNAKQAKISGF